MKPIYVDKNTRGVLIHAVPKSSLDREWIVLIHSVRENLCIRRHVSYCLVTGECYIGETPGEWGYMYKYDLYEPTQEDKKLMKDILKKRKYKFIKILNKMKKVCLK